MNQKKRTAIKALQMALVKPRSKEKKELKKELKKVL